jgi:hypothetical protein
MEKGFLAVPSFGLRRCANVVNAECLQRKQTFIVIVVKLDTGRVSKFIAVQDGFLKGLNSVLKTAAFHSTGLTNVKDAIWIGAPETLDGYWLIVWVYNLNPIDAS